MKNAAHVFWLSNDIRQLSDVGCGTFDIESDTTYGGLSSIGCSVFNMYYYPIGNVGMSKSIHVGSCQQLSNLGMDDNTVYLIAPIVGETG